MSTEEREEISGEGLHSPIRERGGDGGRPKLDWRMIRVYINLCSALSVDPAIFFLSRSLRDPGVYLVSSWRSSMAKSFLEGVVTCAISWACRSKPGRPPTVNRRLFPARHWQHTPKEEEGERQSLAQSYWAGTHLRTRTLNTRRPATHVSHRYREAKLNTSRHPHGISRHA